MHPLELIENRTPDCWSAPVHQPNIVESSLNEAVRFAQNSFFPGEQEMQQHAMHDHRREADRKSSLRKRLPVSL
jgi:hypothetical protein